jgi:NhaA family Na+:H+ antiporter
MKLTKLFTEFFDNEQASGIILILCTIVSLGIANSPLGERYLEFWHAKIGVDAGILHLKYSVEHWINDGLMAIFFLLIGLEIEREIYAGELSDLKNATLPIFAAIGGMMTPALFHFLLNRGLETQSGFGVPMATDIAFALGVLALLKSKIPVALKVFLTALAIIDDLGAILVIALFYVGDFSLTYLLLSMGVFASLLILNRLGVNKLVYFLVPGFFMWYFMLQSGVHATLAGVLLAFAIPFSHSDEKSPSYFLQHSLHKPVAFLIVPLFALANTGIVLGGDWINSLTSRNSMGVFLGLFLGKPLGIFLFSFLAIKVGLARLQGDMSWKHILGAGFLGGIGFTMSIFISLLAFADMNIVNNTKVSILLTSLLSGITGSIILSRNVTPKTLPDPINSQKL